MITFLKRLIAAVPTPSSGKVTFFIDSTSGAPAFKDDAGTTTTLTSGGDVVGPASSTDSNVALFDGATGKLLKEGGSLGSAVAARNTVTAITSTAGAVDAIDYALGDYFTLALSENVTSWAGFSNLPGAGKGCTVMVLITQDATARTVAWPASFVWADGTAGEVSTASGAVDVLALTTFDNGTTWRATLAKAFA